MSKRIQNIFKGVEAVDNIEFGTPERTALSPSEVNKVGQMNEYPIHDVELLKQELKQKPDPEPPVDPIEPPDTDSEVKIGNFTPERG